MEIKNSFPKSKEEVLRILSKPFPKEKLSKKSGWGGKLLSYISIGHAVDRADEAWGDAWEFRIEKDWEVSGFIMIKGRVINPDGKIRECIAGDRITLQKDGKPMKLGDTYKSACSYCLRKCLYFFGIGAYLGHPDPEDAEEEQKTSCQPTSWDQEKNKKAINKKSGGNGNRVDLKTKFYELAKTMHRGKGANTKGLVDWIEKQVGKPTKDFDQNNWQASIVALKTIIKKELQPA